MTENLVESRFTNHDSRFVGLEKTAMKIDGKCHCGNITFVAETDPGQVIICHCTDCQTLTGTPYRVVVRVPTGQDRVARREGQDLHQDR